MTSVLPSARARHSKARSFWLHEGRSRPNSGISQVLEDTQRKWKRKPGSVAPNVQSPPPWELLVPMATRKLRETQFRATRHRVPATDRAPARPYGIRTSPRPGHVGGPGSREQRARAGTSALSFDTSMSSFLNHFQTRKLIFWSQIVRLK